uniref:DUF659 domain-containing protein n=1 Tax=Stegastes partitus TaxID=144197 RepID=A0A3B4ZJ50_9TELE
MEEWGIRSKVTCLVTDGAPNMIACGKELQLRHAVCIAHALSLVVKKGLGLTPLMSAIRTKARKLVGHFRSITTAKVINIIFIFVYMFNIKGNFYLFH